MKTLVIIDVQNDFCPGGSLAVNGGDEIIPMINHIQDHFDLVIATQDWHPAGHESFASSHKGRNVFEKIDLHGLEQVLWPDHCVQGSPGADFHTDLQSERIEAIFRKGMDKEIDSYSGFFDNGRRKDTGLAGFLRARNVDEVYFCGLAADYCVYYSIKDSVREGFRTFLIEDATRPIDAGYLAEIKKELVEIGVRIVRSEDLGLK